MMISEGLLKKLNDVGCIVVMAPEDLTKLIDENRELIAQRDELLAALKEADLFIRNGIGLGFIRMPDKDTPDRAHKVPGIVSSAIAKCEVKS